MAIYFKFKSAKTYDSISVNGPFISVASLKRKIFECNYRSTKKADSNVLCLGTDSDVLIMNAQTNDYYDDDDTLLPIQTRVLIQRVPGTRRCQPIDTTTIVLPGSNVPTSSNSNTIGTSSSSRSGSLSVACGASLLTSVTDCIEAKDNRLGSLSVASNASVFTNITNCGEDNGSALEYDDLFGDDIYLNVKPVPSSARLLDGLNARPNQFSNPGEDDKEDKKIQDLINTPSLDWQVQASYGINSRSYGRMDRRVPPEGYVCHRCQVPGHFIQHCPTNGNPDYDFKKVRPPTGIPKSMLMANSDGSVALQANEASFDKQMEGLASKKLGSANDFPPELLCPLCKHVMKSAVLTSKCCFNSFCDKCIRDYLILSKLKCVCGTTDMLTDFLIPNMTVRNTIDSILESGSGNSSVGENAKTNSFKVEDTESARISKPQTSSAMVSAASSDKKRKLVEAAELGSNGTTEATSGFTTKKEAEAAEKQKVVSDGIGKKKKKRKISKDVEAERFAMPTGYGYYPHNPYWGRTQMGVEGYATPHHVGGMYYGLDPSGMPFNGFMFQGQ